MFRHFLKSLIFIATSVALTFSSSALFAQKTLIQYSGGSIQPALASSAKKVAEGQYEFQLSNKIPAAGNQSPAAIVKKSLEESPKLKSFAIAVTPSGDTAVAVKFSGDEKKFLEALANVRIKNKSAELAMDSSVSDGSVRAKTAERDPAANEVKGQVHAVTGTKVKLQITAAGKSGVAAKAQVGKIIEVEGPANFAAKKGSQVFFIPSSDKPWKTAKFSDK